MSTTYQINSILLNPKMIHSSFSHLSKSPFFSSIITLYTLILLYSPPFLLPFIFSPVFFFTFIILLLLLRLGASQKSAIKPQHQTSQDSTFPQPISQNLDFNPNISPKLDFLKSEKNAAEEQNSHKLINQDSDSAEAQHFNFTQPISKKLHFNPNISPKLDFSNNEESAAEEQNSHKLINEDSDSANSQQETLEDFNIPPPISEKLHFNPNISPKLDFLKSEKNVAEHNSPKLINEDSDFAESQHETLQDINFPPPISEKLQFNPNISPKSDFPNPEASVQEQQNQEPISSQPIEQNPNSPKPNSDNSISSNTNFENSNSDSFLDWNLRSPLEVIYEEEGQNDIVLEKYASLERYYPETDTDSSSSEGDFPVSGEGNSPEKEGFRWDEEEVEGLIEIELYGKGKIEVEEENLIEIDLSPAR